jgi:hypothetical protein
LFRTIHEILFYGRGGYDYETVYNMPIWLRRITHQMIVEYMSKEREAQTSSNSTGNTTNLDWSNPDRSKISPAGHLSKASKK